MSKPEELEQVGKLIEQFADGLRALDELGYKNKASEFDKMIGKMADDFAEQFRIEREVFIEYAN